MQLLIARCGLLVLTLLSSAATAQQLLPEIQGRVFQSSTKLPIQGAEVSLVPSFITGSLNFQRATTDKQGEYRFTKVRDGTYSIFATAKGHVRAKYKDGSAAENGFERISRNTHHVRIDFHLKSEALIQGSVLNLEQRPVEGGVLVAAVRKELLKDGSFRMLIVSTTRTGLEGRFRLNGLPPGTYFVCVNGPHGAEFYEDHKSGYKETWYGSSSNIGGATPLVVREGQELSGLRILVSQQSLFSVIVHPYGPTNTAVNRYDVALLDRNHSGRLMDDGSYVIPDIPDGHYIVVSTAWSGATYVGQGEAEFDVANSDTKVDVAVGGLAEIGGTVKGELRLLATKTGLVVGMSSQEGSAQRTKISADGKFHFDRVLPGHYTVQLLSQHRHQELGEIRCGRGIARPEVQLVVRAAQHVTDCVIELPRH